MSPGPLLVMYCVLILLASLAGGWIPLIVRLTHRRMQLSLSLVAGFMLSIGVLHMLPHAVMEAPVQQAAVATLLGILSMFFMERFFSHHVHAVAETDPPPEVPPEVTPEVGADVPAAETADVHGHAHGEQHHDHHGHTHDHTGEHDHGHAIQPDYQMTWGGAAIGLTVHSLIDGVALAAAMRAESPDHLHGALAGLAVFLVIVLHRPFDALTLGTLMAAGGWSRPMRHLVNALFALVIPVGAAMFYLTSGAGESDHAVAGLALAFSAGVFLCIAMSDLLPELQFHSHDRVPLSMALVLGIALAAAVVFFESGTHEHVPGHPSPPHTTSSAPQ